ncbi:uncharacterized protein LOC105848164 isoform X3 [Hydra vulgaris]|uniref:Uncharacterized protein LOC105848164 isoform X3 n=1 Tax=Hydra vulgaris TaxID=6087 RepID=A0ABM4DPD4_HYDVU
MTFHLTAKQNNSQMDRKFSESSFKVKIYLETFNTSGSIGRDYKKDCCKKNFCDENCLFQFEICYGTSLLHCFTSNTLVENGKTRTTSFKLDSSNITKPLDGSMTHPMIFRSSLSKVTFNLSINIYNQNVNPPSLFNSLSAQFSLDSIGDRKLSLFGGLNKRFKNELSFTASLLNCDDNVKPSDCVEKPCVEHDDDINGHYTCDKNGTIICRNGWSDPSKNCRSVSSQHPFSKVGCYNDFGSISGKRPFSKYVSYRSLIDWNNKKTSLKNITMLCSSYAQNNGFEYFGIEFWGECWTGATTDINYTRDGESNRCWPTPDKNLGPMLVGQDSTIMVYKRN